MTTVTTHVLDTARGRPAAGLEVSLEAISPDGRAVVPVGSSRTDADGRSGPLGEVAAPGLHRLVFATEGYLAAAGAPAFLCELSVTFHVGDEPHLHIPLLLSPYGCSVYRGS